VDVEPVAQTNLQLLGQMRRAGYGEEALDLVARAYAHACELFAGAYRGSGKPFVCHLAGTSSVLVALQSPPQMLAAALLHAAYLQGDFGAGWLGPSEVKRDQVRARVGASTEDLVHRYTVHEWRPDTPARLLERGGSIDREVVLLRLANEVDDHLDLGILYCRDAVDRLARARQMQVPAVELARRLGEPRLAAALEAAIGTCLSGAVPDGLRTAHALSFALAPPSRTLWRWRRLRAMVRL